MTREEKAQIAVHLDIGEQQVRKALAICKSKTRAGSDLEQLELLENVVQCLEIARLGSYR